MPQQQWYYPHQNYGAATTTNYIIQPWITSSNATITYYQPPIQQQTCAWYQTTPMYTLSNADTIWQQWITVPQTYGYGGQLHVETPEEIEHHRVRRERDHQERVAARTRARVLLGEFLSDEQKAELDQHGRFHVMGSRGRRYCIRAEGQAGNVDLLKADGSIQARLCCHPRQGLPDGDAWLMQMIEIRHDEDHFLATANVHRGSLPAAA
jgi:hypothetical protein